MIGNKTAVIVLPALNAERALPRSIYLRARSNYCELQHLPLKKPLSVVSTAARLTRDVADRQFLFLKMPREVPQMITCTHFKFLAFLRDSECL